MESFFRRNRLSPWTRRRSRTLVTSALAALALIFCFACGQPPRSSTAGGGQSIPAIKVKDLQGKELDLGSTAGKVVLINFWATWCGPCKVEIPDLARLSAKYKDQGLQVLGFVVESGSPSEIAPAAKQFGITYPVYLGDDVRDQFPQAPGLPLSLIANRKGQIVAQFFGVQSYEQFEQAVLPLLKEGA